MYTMHKVFTLLTPGKAIWADFKAPKISLAYENTADKENRAGILGRGYGEETSIPEIK